MAAKKQTKNRALGALLPMALMVLTGAAVGYIGAEILLPRASETDSVGKYLLDLGWVLLAFCAALHLQTILHEAGHLVFGLASGYRFVSFRIGSLMWQKDGETLRFCRFTLAGTGGQCLMAPPDLTNGKMPYRLYNLGGVLMNLTVSALAAAAAVCSRELWMLRSFCMLLALIGVASALTNGIPLRVGGIDNDGRNALMLGKDPAAMCALWVQLKVNERQAMGESLGQMPEEWFALPAEGMENPLVAAVAVLRENRLMEQHRFAEAAELTDALKAQNTGIPPMYENLLLCDRLTCALLTGEDPVRLLKRWNRKEMRAFRKQAGTLLTVLRAEYIAALLVSGDETAAKQLWDKFEKQAKRYPMKADVETERGLMALAADAAGKR